MITPQKFLDLMNLARGENEREKKWIKDQLSLALLADIAEMCVNRYDSGSPTQSSKSESGNLTNV